MMALLPDSQNRAVARLARAVGIGDVESYTRNEQGWDSTIYIINDHWVVRVPRREAITYALHREARLLEALRHTLPVDIPHLKLFTVDDGAVVGVYRMIIGERISDALAAGANARVLGAELGAFLAVLHAFPSASAIKAGTPVGGHAAWVAQQRAVAERCRQEVFPLLDESERTSSETLFAELEAASGRFRLSLVHADLGPAHLLCREGHLGGVIDWSDAQLGDPAIDLGWAMYGAGREFAAALQSAYAASGGHLDDSLWGRAARYHQLGPWFEVLYGFDEAKPEFVESGLNGIRARLTIA